MKRRTEMRGFIPYIYILCVACFFSACSTTKNLPEGEVLYTGIQKIEVLNKPNAEKNSTTLDEVEAALSIAPNNSFLGSASMRTPFPIGLWLYNTFAKSEKGLGKWIRDKVAAEPVLISTVNPATRVQVATNLLHDYGYFNGKVSYRLIPQKNPRKEKIRYTVNMGHAYHIDSVVYEGFAPTVDSLIRANEQRQLIKTGQQFDVTTLQSERQRLMYLMRDNGHYYFNESYVTFLADTLIHPGKVVVKVKPHDNTPEKANRVYRIGRTSIFLTGYNNEQPNDTLDFADFRLFYYGNKPAINPGVLRTRMIHKEGDIFSLKRIEYTQEALARLGVFRFSEFTYVPRDTTGTNDTLDVYIRSTFDLPYDTELQLNVANKSTDQFGPGLAYKVTRHNFRRTGGDLNLELKGSYEWQTKKTSANNTGSINSYEVGASLSLNYPRLVLPWQAEKNNPFRFFSQTDFKIYASLLNRSKYFKMLSFGGSVEYKFRRKWLWQQSIAPVMLTFNKLQKTTALFDSISTKNPILYQSLKDQFIPAMRYTLTYDDASRKKRKNTLWWQGSITSAGNLTSLAFAAAGKGLSDKEKKLFNTPYSQFLKLTSEVRWKHTFDYKNQLALRFMGGVIWAYGNSSVAPYSEQFYVGGANSIRAFTYKSIGPGRFIPNATNAYAYMDAMGDIKLEANIEYRFRIMSNVFGGTLNGATFLDAGNVWLMHTDNARPDASFKLRRFWDSVATGTGFGLRYDLSFLVLRLDLGIALHLPYETGKRGYYNIPHFKDGLGLHFAIGYPF